LRALIAEAYGQALLEAMTCKNLPPFIPSLRMTFTLAVGTAAASQFPPKSASVRTALNAPLENALKAR